MARRKANRARIKQKQPIQTYTTRTRTRTGTNKANPPTSTDSATRRQADSCVLPTDDDKNTKLPMDTPAPPRPLTRGFAKKKLMAEKKPNEILQNGTALKQRNNIHQASETIIRRSLRIQNVRKNEGKKAIHVRGCFVVYSLQ